VDKVEPDTIFSEHFDSHKDREVKSNTIFPKCDTSLSKITRNFMIFVTVLNGVQGGTRASDA